MRSVSQYIWRLIHRIREQARSHIQSAFWPGYLAGFTNRNVIRSDSLTATYLARWSSTPSTASADAGLPNTGAR